MSSKEQLMKQRNQALAEARLPTDIDKIVGRTFIFFDLSGHWVAGTIDSVGYSPEEGVSLRVSSPRFHSMDIIRLVPSTIQGCNWSIVTQTENGGKNSFAGMLVLS